MLMTKRIICSLSARFSVVFLLYIQLRGGQEALEILKERSVHLLLSDQRMPQMTGVELCEKAMHSNPDTVRMIVTGYSETKPIDDALNNGMVAHCISKPWDVNQLHSIIEQALDPGS